MAEAAGLYYEVHGAGDAPPLILSSGLGGSASYWKPNIPALAEHFRVIAYDHRGTGRSDRALPETVTVRAMADDVVGLVHALGLHSAHFVGHALGGLIGIELSHRVALQKIVIVNAWGNPDPHTGRCFDARLELLRKSGPAAYIDAQPIFLYPASWSSAHDEAINAEAAIQLRHFPTVENVEKRIAAVRAYREYAGVHDMIPEPVLLISAADDMLVPAHCSRQLQEALSTRPPELVEMPYGGHACNVTDPATFNRIVLDFLRS